ncbi:rod-binding protein [Sphingomonas bacterium]|uniref:rod-binding protein n=1 Tax=Sphingomonas bacterium TaxID=1895847 RepID=UPI00157547C0|nr:rod-binding protein [Sphingomonas bacterium]
MSSVPGTDTPQIGGATGVGNDLGRTATTANLKKAGEKFEAMFTGMMLKSMRQAKLADPLFDSKALDTFTEMSDAKVAQAMAEHQPLGIGKAMTAFLSKSKAVQANLNLGDATPTP